MEIKLSTIKKIYDKLLFAHDMHKTEEEKEKKGVLTKEIHKEKPQEKMLKAKKETSKDRKKIIGRTSKK